MIPITQILDMYARGRCAVVGPNTRPDIDPIAFYMACTLSQRVTIVDRKPHHEFASHGNHTTYMQALGELHRRHHFKMPTVLEADVRRPFARGRFDSLIDHNTFKCIWYNARTPKLSAKSCTDVAQSYARAISSGGNALIIFAQPYSDIYQHFAAALEQEFAVQKLAGFFSERYAIPRTRLLYNLHFNKLEVLLARK